jgi:pyruvate/2-oxoglutarate dehydrogenase complex dihydrolipoamide dehydrogenase (E3) component
VIASGARAAVPPIPGLAEAGYLTNETIFSLTELPARLAIIGAGPIGCEMAQTFARLGAEVLILEMAPRILPRDDADAAAILRQSVQGDGVALSLNCKILRVEKEGAAKVVVYSVNGREERWPATSILAGAGRAPNVDGMNLEAAGVQYDRKRGILVDDHLRTTAPNIFAAGDVCMDARFTHAADFAARIVIQNALFRGRKRLSALTIPWCTYTDPEVAGVGLNGPAAEQQGRAIQTFQRDFAEVDRAITDGEVEGFVKIHVDRGSDRIVGATIVAAHAGDLISEISVAMAGGLGLGALANVIHPYPTRAEAIRQCGDAFNRTRLTPLAKRLLSGWLAITR